MSDGCIRVNKSFHRVILASFLSVWISACSAPQQIQNLCGGIQRNIEDLSGGPINYETCSALFQELQNMANCAQNACSSGGPVVVSALGSALQQDGVEIVSESIFLAAAEGLVFEQEVLEAAFAEQAGIGASDEVVADGNGQDGGGQQACTIDWEKVCKDTWKKHKSKYYQCKKKGFTPTIPTQCQPYINPEGGNSSSVHSTGQEIGQDGINIE